MEHFEVDLTDSGLHISGFPDAVRVVRLSGHKAQQISELASHRHDLLIALACLEGINDVLPESLLVQQGLWRSAVEHCIKCFSDSGARSRLNPKRVFKGDPDALEVYEYFRNLRNKHIAHDENAFNQCIPGAVVNGPKIKHKIAKIVCVNAIVDTLIQDNYGNLRRIVTETLNHIETRFESLCNSLTEELEILPYRELTAMEELTYSKPQLQDIGESRARH